MAKKKAKSHQAKILTDANERLLMSALRTPREKVMVLLSLKAGLRAIEIAGLTWGCVRQSDTVLELTATKGGRRRSVPINKDLRAAIKEYRAERKHTGDKDRLFMNSRDPRKSLTATSVAVWFHDLYTRRMGWEGYSSHSGRRTMATALSRRCTSVGGSLRDVQRILGHASLSTTERYFEASSDAQKRMMDLL